jgi:peroxiredoxin
MLKEGDRASDFTAVDHTGKQVRLADLRGKKIWLWFFSSVGGGN